MPHVAPPGLWPSPITSDLVSGANISISSALTDARDPSGQPALYHLEARPAEKGRVALVYDGDGSGPSQKIDVAGPDFNLRSRVHEYGGGAASVYGGQIIFSDFATNGVFLVRKADAFSQSERVIPENANHRYADFSFHPQHRNLVLAIREDHTLPEIPDVVNELVLIDTDAKSVAVLATGADFYSAGRWSATGEWLCWISWEHPQMPWSGSELYVARFNSETNKIVNSTLRKVAGQSSGAESVSQPRWSLSGTRVHFLSDRSDFYQLYLYDAAEAPKEPRLALPETTKTDFGAPDWELGRSTHAPLDGSRIITLTGPGRLTVIDTSGTQPPRQLPTPFCGIVDIRVLSPSAVACVARKDSEPTVLAVLQLDPSPSDPGVRVIRKAADVRLDLGMISVPQAIEYPTTSGPGWTAHAFLYPPANSEYKLEAGQKPPLIVRCHGGPTSAASRGFNLTILYYTSRGFAFADVNYGGSTGYGRSYRERLNSKWGIVDVADTVACVNHLVGEGLADAAKVAIIGGSAGGYTVLESLCAENSVFGAGGSSYGVSDLMLLASDTHKFESRYLEGLLGGTPEQIPEVYKARSPIYHVDRLKSPMIVLQGADDKVVPPDQAERIVEAVKKNGGRVEYLLFEGEGHGFRQSQNIRKAIEAQLAFFQSVFGLA